MMTTDKIFLEEALLEQQSTCQIEQAWHIVRQARLFALWAEVGAEAHVVGSLRMGLLAKHRDIDLHIYSATLSVADSFLVISRLAENPAIKRVEYANLSDTPEHCIEWHVTYLADNGEEWQIDLIHILLGSRYDGFFEQVADRIVAVLTPETRRVILRLKYETPDTVHIPGIEYYRAVIEGNVRTFDAFMMWRAEHPFEGVLEWAPEIGKK